MKKFNGKTLEELEAISQEVNYNTEDWENGTLGESAKHAKSMKSTSIRLPEELVNDLKDFSGEEGLNYQSYIRRILTLHVKDKKKSKTA